MKILAIIGSGDLGQQIAHYAISGTYYNKVVFFDDISTEKSKKGFDIIGTSADIILLFEQKQFDELVIGIGYKHMSTRQALFDKLIGKVTFGTVIHQTAWIDPTAEVRPGCVIYPGCFIDAHSVISENVIANLNCSIAHDTTIGRHSFLSPRVAVAGFVRVGERCIIGINATLIDNIEIAEKVQIGAGTVVTKTIEKSGLYVGNPHKFIR